MMKKILLVATSMVALSGIASVAAADHNYVGMGLGWTIANMKASTLESDPNVVPPFSSSKKSTMTDRSALSGSLFLGRKFVYGDSAWLIEAKVGKDSAKASSPDLKARVDFGAGVGDFITSVTLKRKYTLGLGVGYSKDIMQDIAAYAKFSLLVSKFDASYKQVNKAAAGETYTGTKSVTKFGLAPTVGFSKKFNSFSLNLDYTFEIYQKIKQNSSFFAANLGNTIYHSTKVTPQYHTVMVSVTKEI